MAYSKMLLVMRLTLLIIQAMTMALHAQTLTTLTSFTLPEGIYPNAMALAQGIDGNLYGTLDCGGAGPPNCFFGGSVFKLTPHGTLTPIYLFCPSQ